ncbi:DNA mismatch repair endonuclease MutL [filamentous cyanobacterium LEGE 07170]|nr:DNA mismatch repair endonuclease MutL [filamentous cyanobacterium LEGE 07170]
MTAPIQTLPAALVQRMAAGEVIDSLAAVVRELAENALDAGANRITLVLWADQWRVQVADNGAGLTLDDLQQAALPHSTSKLTQADELWNVRSLGFRGEALHSLAQLADLEIGSRSVKSLDGWWVTYDRQGNPVDMEVAAIAPGTIVRISNLFADWQARRQSLPSLAQQLRTIQLIIYHLALCHPHVTWQVQQGDRPWFAIWGSETPQQILPQLLRDLSPTDLHHSEHTVVDDHDLQLTLGLPDRCHRYRPDWVKVAVNGRIVRLPELEQSILNAFRRTLPRERHPVCFAHLRLPPDQVDWNRHPAKAELYLKHLDDVRSQLYDAIQTALQQSRSQLQANFYSGRMGQLIRSAEAEGTYPSRQIPFPGGLVADGTEDSDAPTVQAELPSSELRAIAQLHQMYIVAEHSTGIWLIEQHIAHERVLYEHLCQQWQVVSVEPPLILSQLRPAQVEQLQRLNLELAPFGDDLWAVRTLPQALDHREDRADALVELSLGGDFDSALVATACRTAIRNGTPLSLSEMQTLLEQWQATQNPRTCPHGRPICLQLKETSLSRFFRRHWVIGKSHGI